jgi:hypothetical protein
MFFNTNSGRPGTVTFTACRSRTHIFLHCGAVFFEYAPRLVIVNESAAVEPRIKINPLVERI